MKTEAIALGMLCFTSSPVIAAEGAERSNSGPSGTEERAAPASTNAGSPQSGDASAGDIVVTARRREERLQEVPVSVTAVDGGTLAKAGVNNTADLPAVVPGLRFPRSGQSQQPTIRGVGNRASGTANESSIAIYIDGFYQPDSYASAFTLLQTQRIEVLRGPQGTLFGRNSTGGLINIITADPGRQLEGNVELRAGSFNEFSGKAYLSGPLSNSVAADIAVYGYRNSGYIKDLVNGGKINPRRAFAARSKWIFDIGDNTRLIVSGSYMNDKDPSTYAYQPLNGNTRGKLFGAPIPQKPRQSALSSATPPALLVRQSLATARLTHDLGWGTLFVEGSYGHTMNRYSADGDASTALIGASGGHFKMDYQTAEARLVSSGTGPFQWIVGVFGFHAKTFIDPLRVPTYTNQVLTSESLLTGTAPARSLAAFAEVNYEITPHLRATLGGRYTYEKRGYTARSDVTNFLTGAKNVQTVDRDISFKRFTPRAIVQYVFSRQANVYASFSTGFKSGVFNAGSIAGTSVEPEKIKAYEAGIKTEPVRGLILNGSVFHYDYNNLQVSARDPQGGPSIFANAAQAKISGGEVEAIASLGRDTKLRFGAAYLDAKYKNFTRAQVFDPNATLTGNNAATRDVSGNRIQQSPKLTLSSTIDHVEKFDAGDLGSSLSVYYSDAFYWDAANRISQKSYVLLNGEISWRFKNGLRLAVWGENLANENVFLTVVPSANGDAVVYDRPRRGGVSVSYSF